jgi:hypothetical protein
MPSFLGADAPEIAARLQAVASAVATAPVVVRVGDEGFGCRNVAVDLPSGRRPATEQRSLLRRLRQALEEAGVVLAGTAIAPKVWGDIVGNVRVREVAPSWSDAAHFGRTPGR